MAFGQHNLAFRNFLLIAHAESFLRAGETICCALIRVRLPSCGNAAEQR